MRALTLDAPHVVTYRTDVPEPVLERPSDALIRVTLAGLCGSDLHPYEGRERVRPGVVPGHEALGEVVAIGDEVTRVAVGDRVIASFTTSCGTCPPCTSGRTSRCDHGQLFGYGDPDDPGAPALQGAQAELLRVPLADGTLVRVADDVDDATALLAADNAPTGWIAVDRAEVASGDLVVVLGLGAVGLCAVAVAAARGAAVVAVDPVAGRRAVAASLGADTATPQDAARLVAARSATRGADACIEASGSDAGLRAAVALLRAGGVLSAIAVQTSPVLAIAPADAYDRDLTVRFGRAPVRSVMEDVLAAVRAGDLDLRAAAIVTQPDLSLADGPAAYRRAGGREPGLVKAAFRP